MNRTSFSDGAKTSLRAATLIAFAIYVTCTLIWVLPLNPIQLQTHKLLDATFARYFGQNWRLFAPDPVFANDSLLVACLSASDTRKADAIGASEWYDISTPIWHAAERHRLSAYDRIVRPQTHAARAFLSGRQELREWAESCQRGNKDACDYFKEEFEGIRRASQDYLRKIASAACVDLRGPGTARVAVRIRERIGVPWSERYSGHEKVTDFDVGLLDAVANIAPANIFSDLPR